METDSRLKILTCSSLHVIILTIQNAFVIILCVLLKIHIKIHKENNSVQHAYLIAWDFMYTVSGYTPRWVSFILFPCVLGEVGLIK